MSIISKRRRLIVPALLIAGALSLAACSTTSSPGGNASSGGGGDPQVVWLEQGSGNPYWDAQHKAAAAAADKLGFSFRVVSGNSDPAQQASQMRQLVDQGVNTIMLNAIDPTAMKPALQYAKEKKVHVVNLYGTDDLATANIGFDEVKSGEVAAKYAASQLKERYGSVEGEVAVLTGVLGQPASDQRAKGFTDYMAKQSGVKVVAVQPTDWQGDKASATMQNWLTKYPDLALVYSLSDTIGVPAMNVAQRANRLCTKQDDWTKTKNCVSFVSVDGAFLNEVVSGRLWSTQLYSAEWSGYQFAALAGAIAKGDKFQQDTLLSALLVTSENGACVKKMQDAMTKDPSTFDFDGTLEEIASKDYGCKIVTVEGE